MQKSVGAQKLLVYVWDSTTGLPKTGDAANLTAYVSIDWGSVTVLGDTSATEMDSTNAKGYYVFDLTQAETNGNTLLFSCKSATSNMVCKATPDVVQTVPSSFVVAPGSAGALVVAGSNAPTTFAGSTSTAGLTITGGTSATGALTITGGSSSGAGIIVTTTSGDGITLTPTAGHGITATGQGTTKHGINATGGATTSHGISATGGGVGHGILATSGGGSTGDGIRATAASTNGNALNLIGVGTGRGLLATGGLTGQGATFIGGGTSGAGITITTTSGDGFSITPTAGSAIVATGNGTSKHGIIMTGGTAGTSDGFSAVAGTGGVPIRGNITGTVSSFVVKKNAAKTGFQFFMRDAVTGLGKTGLTITAKRSIDGAALGACANAATELSLGYYTIDLAAADLNGDTIGLLFTATGAFDAALTIATQP